MSLQMGSQWPGGTSSFMQQGQVDWVAFGNTIWTASSAVLQRFAAAGIQPVTYGAGIVLASQIHLDRVGQSRMEKAISSLRASPGFKNLLWFGFGYQSFVGTMAETVAGIKCLAICSCLAESHSEELAAWVLSEWWRVSKFPVEYEPSHAQFLALIKASAGVVSGTDFSQCLDTMLGEQLWRQPSGSHYTRYIVREIEDGVLEASNAKDIANTLHGLFKVSRGEADHLLITGGSECAFISAVAHWLLNITVIVRNSDGQVIFDTVKKGSARYIVLQYGEMTNEPLQVASTTYVLGNCREVFGRVPNREEYHLTVRTPWSCCLSRVFGTHFTTLSKMPHILGDYLGGAARIYRAVAIGESNIGSLSRLQHVHYTETSYGLGFISTVTTTFPELSNIDGLYDCMQHAINLTFDEAIRNVEQSILSLEALCTCDYCSSDQDPMILVPNNSRSCLVGVAYAIRRIAVVMSYVVQDPENPQLLPAVNGIYEFSAFGKQPESAVTKVREGMADFDGSSKAQIGKSSLDEGHRRTDEKRVWKRADFYWNALGLRHEQRVTIEFDYHPLEPVCLLFHGFTRKNLFTDCSNTTGMSLSDRQPFSAVSRQGICCYIEVLKGLNCQAERLGRVHLLAGQIHCKNRRHDFVEDNDVFGSQIGGREDSEAAILQEPSTSSPNIKPGPTITNVEALVSEGVSETAITFVYRVTLPNASYYIAPGKLTKSVLENTGLIVCEGRRCRSNLAIPSHHVIDGWRISSDNPKLKHQAGIACCIWTYENDVARTLAMVLHMRRHSIKSKTSGHFVFLRRNECFPCCTESILEASGRLMDRRIADKDGQRNIVVHVM